MFYSESLLSKTGPLARVWLSANLERKVSKTHILQSNIESSVNAIVHPGQAPMALRLSGQLLLGVVRIYSRKARYLLDDCNEALMKLKMTFRPGNVDLPANQLTASANMLTLPDTLTDLDLLPPLPDAALLFGTDGPSDGRDIGLGRSRRNRDITLGDYSTQQLTDSIEYGRGGPEVLELPDEGDLGLDIGEDLDFGDDTAMEIGREAPAARPIEDEMTILDATKLPENDLGLDIGYDGPTFAPEDNLTFNFGGDDQLDLGDSFAIQRARQSGSPTAFRLQSTEAALEDSFEPALESTILEEDDLMPPTHRVRKRKYLEADSETMIREGQIERQQRDRSRILQAPSFLPKDPYMLYLLALQKNGGFVANIFDGRGKNWAPEIQNMFSLENVRKAGQLKRRRDSGVGDLSDEDDGDEDRPDKMPRISFGLDDGNASGPVFEDDIGFMVDDTNGTILHLADGPAITFDHEDVRPGEYDDEDFGGPNNFDQTIAPLLHPADDGPISQGTKHAVHLLRERFGSDSADSPARRAKAAVKFHELLPESSTTKADATKMFFEILVLATKDAVKVEQPEGVLGGPISVRGKRGLWGDWAEQEAGGEIENQNKDVTQSASLVAATA